MQRGKKKKNPMGWNLHNKIYNKGRTGLASLLILLIISLLILILILVVP